MAQVCKICGDPGFADCLFICYQCNEVAEHVYCMLKQPESDEEAFWSCEECKAKQKTITEKVAVPSLHSEDKQPLARFGKQQKVEPDSLPVNKKQVPKSSYGTESISFSKKQARRNSNYKSLPQSTCSAVAVEPAKAEGYGKSQEMFTSLQSDGPSSIPETGKLECQNTASLPVSRNSFQHSSKENSLNRSAGRQSPSSVAQMAPVPLSPGSKITFLGKSQDASPSFQLSSQPNSSEVEKRALKGSKGIGSESGKSLLHRKSSELKMIEPNELISACSMKGMDSTKERPELIKTEAQRHDMLIGPEALSLLEVDKEDCRGLTPKAISSGPSSKNLLKLDKNEYKQHMAANDDKEKSKSFCNKSLAVALNNGILSPKIAGKSNMDNLEKATTKTSLCESNRPIARCLPDTVVHSFNENRSRQNNRIASIGTEGFNVFSAGAINNSEEIDQRLVGNSATEDVVNSDKIYGGKVLSSSSGTSLRANLNNINERDLEINKKSSEQNSTSQDMDETKLDTNAGSWNTCAQRSSNEQTKADIGQPMMKTYEINIQASSAMENRPFNTCEGGGMGGSLLSDVNNSSGTPRPSQNQIRLPQVQIVWKGTFKVVGASCGHCTYDGIHAYPSITASPKVYEVTKTFGSELHLEQVRCADAWPKRFEESPPTDDNIGLYFFPASVKSEESYSKLVEETSSYGLAMRMPLKGAELLIYSSNKLPKYVQRIQGKFYLWGVFRRVSDHKVQAASASHKHVGASILSSNPNVPCTGNAKDSVTRVVTIPMHKNGDGKEDMDVDMEGEKDVGLFGRPLKESNSQPAGLPTRHISHLSVTIDSGVNLIQPSQIQQDDADTGRCVLSKQDPSSTVAHMIRSKMICEDVNEEVTRRTFVKPIIQFHEQDHRSGNREEVDDHSDCNLSTSHALHRNHSLKSLEAMSGRSNVHRTHESMHKGELPPGSRASNSIHVLEEKDKVLESGTKSLNRTPGFVSLLYTTDGNPHPSSPCLLEKQGCKQFQAEPSSKVEARKQMDSRDEHLAFPSRINGIYQNDADGYHISYQSSLSSGESDNCYEDKQCLVSGPPHQRQVHRSGNAIKISRIQSLKENHVDTRIRREKEERDEREEAAKLRMERHNDNNHNHWHKKNKTRSIQMERHTKNHVINNRGGSHSCFYSRSCSHSCSCLHRCSCDTVNSSDSYSHERHMNAELLIHRPPSSDGQIHSRKYVDKNKVDMDDNFRPGKHERSFEKRAEAEMVLLDVKEASSIIRSEALEGQHQLSKDQWSFTPFHKSTDETAENNNVSEVSNAASALQSPEGQYSGENVPREYMEVDLSVAANSRPDHTSESELDQHSLVNNGNWYDGSSSGQAVLEPMACLELFPLEEENLGMAKIVVNDWDVDLDLGLGRKDSQNVLTMAERRVYRNYSQECSPDVSQLLSLSVPPVQKEV